MDALRLPLLEVAGHPPRIKRATLIVDHERVVREVMYPVPDPGANAAEAMAAVAKRVGGQVASVPDPATPRGDGPNCPRINGRAPKP